MLATLLGFCGLESNIYRFVLDAAKAEMKR